MTNLRFLSLAFLFIFLGFNSSQAYVTPYFQSIGNLNAGFISLLIIYSVFIIFNPLAAVVVSKVGPKKAMMLGALTYNIFIFCLIFGNIYLSFLAAALIGIGAGLLWTGQTSYLIKISSKEHYGSNSGFFYMIFALGSFSGLWMMQLLVNNLDFKLAFLISSMTPLIGIVLLSRLEDLKQEISSNNLLYLKRAFKSKTALRLSLLPFSFFIMQGLAFGMIPFLIKTVISQSVVGELSSIIQLMPILASFFIGRTSDYLGRIRMINVYFALGALSLLTLFFAHSAEILILGIILMSLTNAVFNPIRTALTGDVSTERNLNYIVALFWMSGNVGVVTALSLSTLSKSSGIFLILLGILLAAFILISPSLRVSVEELKSRVDQEI